MCRAETTVKRILTKAKSRVELKATAQEVRPLVQALQDIANVKNPNKVASRKAAKKRGYFNQVGHTKAACPSKEHNELEVGDKHRSIPPVETTT